jgi:hypothetical protein
MTSRNHRVKTWPGSFGLQLAGQKSFTIRLNDRLYQMGDTLTQCEFDPKDRLNIIGKEDGYTGREFTAEILCVISGFGLQPGHVVLQLGTMYNYKESV